MEQRRWLWAGLAGLIGLLLATTSLPAFAARVPGDIPLAPAQLAPTPQAGNIVQGPFAAQPVAVGKSVSEAKKLPRAPQSTQVQEVPRLRRAPSPRTPNALAPLQRDPVAQTSLGKSRAPTPIQNFEGQSFTNWYPPDTNGDVGPNHYVQTVNASEVAIYNKSGTLLANFHYNSLFPLANFPCNNPVHRGDPIVLYDALDDRWILSDFANNSRAAGPFYQCIAISQTADPTGAWWTFTLDAGVTGVAGVYLFNDYPKLAVWSDGIYMSADMFDTSDIFQYVRVWAFNRSDFINGVISARVQYFNVGGGYAHLLPSNLRGATLPPAGSPNFMLSIDAPNTLHLWKFHVDWNNINNSTLTGPTNLTTASFVMPCNAATFDCVPQFGGAYLDALGDRPMMQLQYRNIGGTESLWVNHTVAAGSGLGYPTGVRWYEIRNPNSTPFIYQQGTFQPDSNYRWMGSLAVDGQGNMALGYSVTSSTMHPAIRYTGRFATDPLGVLCLDETSLVESNYSQTSNGRWGDYSAMTIDPTDDLTFWYTNQYPNASGTWNTRIGSFKIGNVMLNIPRPYIYYFPVVGKTSSTPCY